MNRTGPVLHAVRLNGYLILADENQLPGLLAGHGDLGKRLTSGYPLTGSYLKVVTASHKPGRTSRPDAFPKAFGDYYRKGAITCKVRAVNSNRTVTVVDPSHRLRPGVVLTSTTDRSLELEILEVGEALATAKVGHLFLSGVVPLEGMEFTTGNAEIRPAQKHFPRNVSLSPREKE